MTPDPGRYLVGGSPQSVVIPARIARVLDRAVLDDFRRRARGMDTELDANLAAVHLAGLQYAEIASANGRTELPPLAPVSCSSREDLDAVTVARRLGCTTRNVRDLCIRGRLSGRKVGGRWFVAPEALDGYLAEREDLTR